MKHFSFVKWVVLALALSGCSMDASILDLKKGVTRPFMEKTSGAEFVSGAATKYQKSPGQPGGAAPEGYYVMSSVGHFLPKQAMKTPVRHYIVFSTVQGNMFSDELYAEGALDNPAAFNPQ
ncbi:MAG TPA: hypothetical protein PL182_07185 [Pseudobdellovibrionaceae bacterium]|nr:hypothetical protein [Pseudobdellovibrionaceae bacterium]